ncbi:hypothetical protein D4764_01G0010030 [Takifugu flavidus]|uniref:Reverse transcriptase domain-containing protein n=1 Tax=Takifugu flavidus TaxID=433684 RepID=A0A5C6PQW5_9TELE|nr:hypothetical protein D4764_01G0010030 [Takifugu flavidus]
MRVSPRSWNHGSPLAGVLEGSWEFAQPVHMCFVDLEKAYDRVPRSILWGVLREYGVEGLLIRAIQSLYQRSRSVVRIAGCKSNSFPVRAGPLSPVLFITFMDRISRRSQGVEGVKFGGRKISSLLFADDAVLLAPSNRDLQQVLGRFATECLLRVGEEVLPQVEELKYLGILFTSEVLTYGHQRWVMTERTRSRIQAAEMSFLHRVAGLNLRDRVRSSDIREGLGVELLLLHTERSQLGWLGHLARMPSGRLPLQVFRTCPTGRRPPGWARTRWRDYISRLVYERLGVPPEELMEVAGERAVWASLLQLLPPRPGSG